MTKYDLYHEVVQRLIEYPGFLEESFLGKRVLVVGNHVDRPVDGKTLCESMREWLLAQGARECLVFGALMSHEPTPAQRAAKDSVFAWIDDIGSALSDAGQFDAVIVLEGMEQALGFGHTLHAIRQLCRAGGTLLLLGRAPSKPSDELEYPWQSDIWRFDLPAMQQALADDDAKLAAIHFRGVMSWLLAKARNNSREIPAGEIRMYSTRVGRSITDSEAAKLGHFRLGCLEFLGERYFSDKSRYTHNYLGKYEHLLAPLRDEAFTLLELGVLGGGSIRMWRDYFQRAQIIGVDINPECRKHAGDRIQIEIADLGKSESLARLQRLSPRVIIDDASHRWNHQIQGLFTLFPCLPSGGIYIVEDLETSLSPDRFPEYADCEIDAYTLCERIARVAASRSPCTEEPFAAQVTAIGLSTELVAIMTGSCILVKR